MFSFSYFTKVNVFGNMHFDRNWHYSQADKPISLLPKVRWRFAILNTCRLNLPKAFNIFHSIYLLPKHIERIRIGYRTIRIDIYMETGKWKLKP